MAPQIFRPVINIYHLEAICLVIGDTETGLKGSEIGLYLANCKIEDVDPTATKWKRLFNAFVTFQNKQKCSNNILDFLKSALNPARYIGKMDIFESRRHEVNKALSFIGVEITERGTLIAVDKTKTLSEAEQKASHFKYKLEIRNVHPEIFKYCRSELLVENYFHSVFEGVKSIADRIREMTGLYADGNALAEVAFAVNNPLIRINLLENDTHRSEHLGLANIIKGLFGLIRNPTAHTPKIHFPIEEEDALDILTTISLVHKKLDKAF